MGHTVSYCADCGMRISSLETGAKRLVNHLDQFRCASCALGGDPRWASSRAYAKRDRRAPGGFAIAKDESERSETASFTRRLSLSLLRMGRALAEARLF